MAAVGEFLRLPNICHKDIVGTTEELALTGCLNLEDIGTLSPKGLVGTLTTARVRELLPRPKNIFCREETGSIGCPARTARGYHPVDAVALEDRRRLILTACRHTHKGSTLKAQISKETPEFTKKVTLSPSIRKVGFNFARLSYGNAQKTLYAYRLEGYDDKWNYCRENSHHAVFQNLPSGTYHLFIRATDSQGHWQQMPYSITVRVLPPWYASWWAYLIYLALLAIAVAAGIEWYKRHLKTQNSLRMGVILTNITHELLTPLTVISATIYKLRKQAPVYENEYQVIDGNINRLTRLLRQILEVRKGQAGQLRLKVTRGDLTAFVAQKAESIRPMAEEQLLLFNVNVPEKASMAWFDPDKLDKIIYNLLSNAI